MFIFSEVQVAPSACLRSKQRLRGNLHGLVPLPFMLCLQVRHHEDDHDYKDDDGEEGKNIQDLASVLNIMMVFVSFIGFWLLFFFSQVCKEPLPDNSRLIWGAYLWQWRLSKPPTGRWQCHFIDWWQSLAIDWWQCLAIDLLEIRQMLWSLVRNAKSCNPTQHPSPDFSTQLQHNTWHLAKGPWHKVRRIREIPRPELIFKSWRIDLPKNIQCVPPQSQFTLQPPSSSLYDICLALSHIAPHQSVS